jgi:xanthine dehydrogenase YagS FAD-binding subunit
MKDFEYRRAENAEQAASAGALAAARFIAGGTLLVDLLRLDVERPELVVDINGLGWDDVEDSDGGLRIGALVKNSDLAHHPLVQGRYRVLSEALLSGASPQVRNMASVGGNLLQRTRCSYFRDVGVSACNKRSPGSGCAAREGYSRMHAVLGGSQHCIAAHPSDMNVALVALDATLEIEGPNGKRELPVTELHTLPGEHPEIETTLTPGELISHVRLPPAEGLRSAYVKARDRASFAFALASAAAVLELDGKSIRRARVAFGGVGTKPWRSAEIERALTGQPATREVFEKVASLGFADAQTTPHNAFKVQLAQRTLIVALERATEQA